MELNDNLTLFLREIADALRYAKDITGKIHPQDFAMLIREFKFNAIGRVLSDGTITLLKSMLNNGTYTLRYEHAEGYAIDNFKDICKLVVSNSDVSYTDFIDVNIPPYLAEYIGIYNENEERIGSLPLNSFKPSFGNRLYRFGLLSDVHDYEGSDAEPSDDFQKALSLFNNKEDVIMTCICGDISENGSEKEFQLYQSDVRTLSPNIPVYTTTGNHDCRSNGNVINTSLWESYTGKPITFELTQPRTNGVDHFLFLGMEKWDFTNAYASNHLTWLEGKLEEYKNERCFVFTHLFFPHAAGNFKEIYPTYNWLSGEQLTRLENMLRTYKNTVWFSGHSHWKWELQKYEEKANVYREIENNKAKSGWCVHVPSCACPIDSDGITTREPKPLEAQGAVVDVYENYIDIRGIDIKNKLYIPIATYRLDTTLISIGSTDSDKEENEINPSLSGYFEKNPFTNSNNDDTYPLVRYNANTDTYTMTFTTGAQKLIYVHPLLTSDVTSEDISISATNIKYLRNGVEIELSDSDKKGIGFYQKDGYYGINMGYGKVYYPSIYTDDSGFTRYHLQFNSSSSKYKGEYPLTIEITGLRISLITDSENTGGNTTIGKYLKASDFTHNTSKYQGMVVDSEEEGYVDITFYNSSSGYYVTSESFNDSVVSCQLVVDDLTLKTNGNVVTSIDKCGFYTTDSQYTMSNGALLQVSSKGVQFNTSSSCTGPYPIVIHMKAKLLFS